MGRANFYSTGLIKDGWRACYGSTTSGQERGVGDEQY